MSREPEIYVVDVYGDEKYFESRSEIKRFHVYGGNKLVMEAKNGEAVLLENNEKLEAGDLDARGQLQHIRKVWTGLYGKQPAVITAPREKWDFMKSFSEMMKEDKKC